MPSKYALTNANVTTPTEAPIKFWTPDMTIDNVLQALAVANVMPIPSHLSWKPNGCPKKGTLKGGVLPLVNAIAPNCIGDDIGCGVLAVQTNLTEISEETLKHILTEARRIIATGRDRDNKVFWDGFKTVPPIEAITKEIKQAEKQFGTLGIGNHYVEIQQGSDGYIWWVIHAGSRDMGSKITNYYHNLAVSSGIVPERCEPLAYFSFSSDLGQEYYTAMNLCLEYARENRQVISRDIERIFRKFHNVHITDTIDTPHNYAESMTLVSGKEVILHRKEASAVAEEKRGVISSFHQGEPSYIVRGSCNTDIAHSSPLKMSLTHANIIGIINDCSENMDWLNIAKDVGKFPFLENINVTIDLATILENQMNRVEVVTVLTSFDN